MHQQFRIAFISWLATLLWALLLVGLLPDDLLGAQPIFTLSSQHGPTAIDALGIIPVIAATSYYAWCIWLCKKHLNRLDYIFIGMWVVGVVGAILAARFNLTPLLIGGSVLGVSSLIALGRHVVKSLNTTAKTPPSA